jgi:hypothetical protein
MPCGCGGGGGGCSRCWLRCLALRVCVRVSACLSAQAWLSSVGSSELGMHPTALPNLLRASAGKTSTAEWSVALPQFQRGATSAEHQPTTSSGGSHSHPGERNHHTMRAQSQRSIRRWVVLNGHNEGLGRGGVH